LFFELDREDVFKFVQRVKGSKYFPTRERHVCGPTQCWVNMKSQVADTVPLERYYLIFDDNVSRRIVEELGNSFLSADE
jgi:hypothetical protein